MICNFENCKKPTRAKGYCSTHLQRLYRHGDVYTSKTNNDKKPKYKSLKENLYSGFVINAQTDCWEWKRSLKKFGYGNLWHNSKHHMAHRISWVVHFGAIPANMCVLHVCDNPSCVNPGHLRIGTYLDNNKDRKNKKRNANTFGEKNPFSKLTQKNVHEIKLSLKRKEKGRDIAKKFNVHESTISKIKKGINWK